MRALDLADAREILVQLAAVLGIQLLRQRAGIVADEIQDRSLALLPMREASAALLRRAVAEQPLEHQPRIRLRRHRRRRRPPRNVELICAGIAAVATAGVPHGVARQFERREPREMADVLGGDLVDRRADMRYPSRPFSWRGSR